MRCYVKGGRYGGNYGTIGGSEYDEETGKYECYVLLDTEDEEDEPTEELINVKHLRALTDSEWWFEAVENDTKDWDTARMLNFIRMPIYVTKPPKYRGIPLRPYRTGSGRTLSLFDMPEELASELSEKRPGCSGVGCLFEEIATQLFYGQKDPASSQHLHLFSIFHYGYLDHSH
jgi:hypothetical protein